MPAKEKKCGHPSCNCAVADNETYCSQYCKDAGDTLEISCNCAHAGCAIGEAETPRTLAGSLAE